MTEAEAFAVVGVLLAGFPNATWGDTTIALAVDEFRPLGRVESMTAARATIRNHKFLTFSAFYTELARVREQHHDQHRSDLSRLALPPVPERFTPKEEAKAHIAAIRAELLTMKGPLATSLGRVVAGPPPPPRYHGAAPARPDENYFNPPQPPEPPAIDSDNKDTEPERPRGSPAIDFDNPPGEVL